MSGNAGELAQLGADISALHLALDTPKTDESTWLREVREEALVDRYTQRDTRLAVQLGQDVLFGITREIL